MASCHSCEKRKDLSWLSIHGWCDECGKKEGVVLGVQHSRDVARYVALESECDNQNVLNRTETTLDIAAFQKWALDGECKHIVDCDGGRQDPSSFCRSFWEIYKWDKPYCTWALSREDFQEESAAIKDFAAWLREGKADHDHEMKSKRARINIPGDRRRSGPTGMRGASRTRFHTASRRMLPGASTHRGQ